MRKPRCGCSIQKFHPRYCKAAYLSIRHGVNSVDYCGCNFCPTSSGPFGQCPLGRHLSCCFYFVKASWRWISCINLPKLLCTHQWGLFKLVYCRCSFKSDFKWNSIFRSFRKLCHNLDSCSHSKPTPSCFKTDSLQKQTYCPRDGRCWCSFHFAWSVLFFPLPVFYLLSICCGGRRNDDISKIVRRNKNE